MLNTADLQAAAKIDSNIRGVQFGLQPFCYNDLPMSIEHRPILIQRMIQNGSGVVELHAVWVEPRFTGPGIDAAVARNKTREWRLSRGPGYYKR
ncbi:MAG: hypothetical protein ACRD40_02135 [Candidatus Acidiferrales bacterium]